MKNWTEKPKFPLIIPYLSFYDTIYNLSTNCQGKSYLLGSVILFNFRLITRFKLPKKDPDPNKIGVGEKGRIQLKVPREKRFALRIFQITQSVSNLRGLWEVSGAQFFSIADSFQSFELAISLFSAGGSFQSFHPGITLS